MAEVIIYILAIVWILLYIIQIIHLYKNHSKPYISDFLESSYDKVPSNLNPSEISMLLYKNITPGVFTMIFMILIKKNIVKTIKEDNDYTFIYEENNSINPTQKHLIYLLFECIGENGIVKLSQISSFCNVQSNCSNFLSEYKIFKRLSFKDIKHNFYEEKKGYLNLKVLTVISIIIMISNFIFKVNFYPIYLIFLPTIFMYYYFYKIFKRTKEANTEYFKWLGYKNYLINKKDLKEDDREIVFIPVLGIERLVIIQNTLTHKVHRALNKCILKAILNGDRSIHFKWKKLK